MYDRFATHYHEKRSSEEDSTWNRYLDQPMIRDLVHDQPAGLKVLDLGCGSGMLAPWLTSRGYDVCGVDFSENLIAIARTTNPSAHFAVADIKHAPFADGTFDLVVSGLVMHYEQDLGPPFAEVSRLLKAGGRFVFTMHHPMDEVTDVEWNGSDYVATMNPYFHNKEYRWTMLEGMELVSYHHTFECISEHLSEHGFVIERIKESRASEELKQRFPDFYRRTSNYPSFCGFRARKTEAAAGKVI